MYVWIDSERWAADGQPPITELHGLLMDPTTASQDWRAAPWYGRILTAEETRVIVHALVEWRAQPELPVPM